VYELRLEPEVSQWLQGDELDDEARGEYLARLEQLEERGEDLAEGLYKVLVRRRDDAPRMGQLCRLRAATTKGELPSLTYFISDKSEIFVLTVLRSQSRGRADRKRAIKKWDEVAAREGLR
jgi:hypothetical protein